jgi:hypothetical protein
MQLAGGVAAAGIPQFAHALDYPTRPVRVPFFGNILPTPRSYSGIE